MILLDTDHLTVLKYLDNLQYGRLRARMEVSSDRDFATTIVNAEEQLRGWLAEINRQQIPQRQVVAYDRLQKLLDFLSGFSLIAFDERGADEFERLRKAKVRIGSADLKIACIALVRKSLLLSANLRDFGQVPNLQVENWLEE